MRRAGFERTDGRDEFVAALVYAKSLLDRSATEFLLFVAFVLVWTLVLVALVR